MTAALHCPPLRPTGQRRFDVEAAVALRAPHRPSLWPAVQWRGGDVDAGIALRALHYLLLRPTAR